MSRCMASRLFETWTGRGWHRRSVTAGQASDSDHHDRSVRPAGHYCRRRSRWRHPASCRRVRRRDGADRQADDHPAAAIDRRGEVHLAGLVRSVHAEVEIQKVIGRRLISPMYDSYRRRFLLTAISDSGGTAKLSLGIGIRRGPARCGFLKLGNVLPILDFLYRGKSQKSFISMPS